MPKHSRPPWRGPEHIKNADSWSRQPRPLENGNWVCDDPHCANVNYPRRTECFKCKKQRGPIGDTVVKAFIEKMKLVKGTVQQHQSRVTRPTNGIVSPGPTLVMDKLDPWIGLGMEQFPFESPRLHGEHHYFGHRSTTSSVAPEGRRLAEHLVACFAASSDPIADAGECLTSAVLWLQSLKLRWHGAEEHALSGSSLISIGSPTFGNLSLGVNSSVNMLLQPQYASGMVPGVLMGMGNPLPRPNSSVSISSNTRTLLRASLKWEDYKDRPSDFLKEFGDPAAMTAATFGGGLKPEPGVNGNWECEACHNVNFPRRTCCFQCRKKRGAKGDELVQKYVHGLFSDGDRIWAR